MGAKERARAHGYLSQKSELLSGQRVRDTERAAKREAKAEARASVSQGPHTQSSPKKGSQRSVPSTRRSKLSRVVRLWAVTPTPVKSSSGVESMDGSNRSALASCQ